MKHIKSEERLGLIKKNKNKTDMEVIKVINNDKIIIRFLDEYKFKKEVYWNNFKAGTIKNPYDKIIDGVGYVGVGEYKTVGINGKLTRSYITWHDMLVRCYREEIRHKHPAYKGCTVCEKWHNYQNFARWYDKNYYEIGKGRMHLDKDILKNGNKLYCPEFCVFVPQRINMIFMSKPNKWDLPCGINRTSSGKYSSSYNGKSLGTYNSINDALIPYYKEKESHIHLVAEEYKSKIPKKLYKTLKNYKTE